jgi:hypothetical protein
MAACANAGLERMKYRVALTRKEEGYSVSCPGLSGCWPKGATANIRDAIHDYLGGGARDGIILNWRAARVRCGRCSQAARRPLAGA